MTVQYDEFYTEIRQLRAEIRQLRAEFDKFKGDMLAAIQQTPPQVNLAPLEQKIAKLDRELNETREWVKNMPS